MPIRDRTRLLPIAAVLIVISVFGVSYYALQRISQKSPQIADKTNKAYPVPSANVKASPTPTPKPIIPIIKGKETYSVSYGKDTVGPQISQVIVDPHDPSSADQQQFSVTLAPKSKASSIVVTINSDNKKTTTHNLTFQESTDKGDVWTGSWVLSDPHLYTYGFVIDAVDASGKKNHLVISVR